VFRDQSKIDEAGERVMDSEDQERERGITILSKNLAIMRKKEGELHKVCVYFANSTWLSFFVSK
jgi:predicted membrane GTPase involved in stress response